VTKDQSTGAGAPKRPSPRQTWDELMAAIERAKATPTATDDGWYSAHDLVMLTGWSYDQVDRMLRQLHDAGQIESSRVYRRARDGSMRLVPAYRAKRS
jgi:hypothetical protein